MGPFFILIMKDCPEINPKHIWCKDISVISLDQLKLSERFLWYVDDKTNFVVNMGLDYIDLYDQKIVFFKNTPYILSFSSISGDFHSASLEPL